MGQLTGDPERLRHLTRYRTKMIISLSMSQPRGGILRAGGTDVCPLAYGTAETVFGTLRLAAAPGAECRRVGACLAHVWLLPRRIARSTISSTGLAGPQSPRGRVPGGSRAARMIR